MRIIDSHQHFWKYHPQKQIWINDEMSCIKKDFLPETLFKIYSSLNIDGCISVQVDQTIEETIFQLECAQNNPFIKGVVGWIDLMNPLLDDDIEVFRDKKLIKGFRHILQGADKGFMLQKEFINGLKTLSKHDYRYDLLIYSNQIREATKLINSVDDLKVVLDHIGKPSIKTKQIHEWSLDLQELAKYPNVYCKISGIVTEAAWHSWYLEDLRPYLDKVIEVFGIDRILFGSDWPVCLVATEYDRWLNTLLEYFEDFSMDEKEKVFAKNCEKFYKLND